MARRRSPVEESPRDELRWRDARGRLVRCWPPPSRHGEDLTRGEVVAWAERWDVPVAAVLRWFEQPDRAPGRVTLHPNGDIMSVPPGRRGVV